MCFFRIYFSLVSIVRTTIFICIVFRRRCHRCYRHAQAHAFYAYDLPFIVCLYDKTPE